MAAGRIPIAVVGTGFGTRIQVPAFRASGRFDVLALVGRTPERVKKLALHLNVPHAFTSLDDIGIDAASNPAAATFADGVACQRVMDAARAAAVGGRWITVGSQRATER
jgi:predicted dehydrogenase